VRDYLQCRGIREGHTRQVDEELPAAELEHLGECLAEPLCGVAVEVAVGRDDEAVRAEPRDADASVEDGHQVTLRRTR